MIKQLIIALAFIALTACGGGGSDSGSAAEVTLTSDAFPARFVGIYTGVVNFTATATGLSESDSFPITVTVFADGRLRFDGDDPEETVTVVVDNNGQFVAAISIAEAPCTATFNVNGSVDGVTAAGAVDGQGSCSQDGLTIDVVLTGDFSASR